MKSPPRYNWNIVESGVKHHKSSYIESTIHTMTNLYTNIEINIQIYIINNDIINIYYIDSTI
jgi:hypothetical protein